MPIDYKRFEGIYFSGSYLGDEERFLKTLVEYNNLGHVFGQACIDEQKEARNLNTKYNFGKGSDGWYSCVVPDSSGEDNVEYMKKSKEINEKYSKVKDDSQKRKSEILMSFSLEEYFIYEVFFGIGFTLSFDDSLDYLTNSSKDMFSKSCICNFLGIERHVKKKDGNVPDLLRLMDMMPNSLSHHAYNRAKKKFNISGLNVSSKLKWMSMVRSFKKSLHECLNATAL
jgi:hypothetical protein